MSRQRDEADVVVIGGGIAGLSAAWALAADRTVVVVEQEPQVAMHATGRSAAVISETVGTAAVCALAAASRPFLDRPPPGFTPVPLTGPRGLLWVSDRPGRLDPIADTAARLGIRHRFLAPAEAAAMVPVLRPQRLSQALLEPDAMTIDVAALVAGYRSGLARRGGRVETARGAVSLEAGTDGWTVTTAGGGVLGCRYVVNAAGAWADSVARRAGVGPLGLQPYRRTAFVFAVAGHRTAGWPLVMDSRERFYFEPDPAGLLASPADETPVEPHDARADELAMARATEALGESTTLAIRGVRHRWAGLRTFVADRVPVAGFDPRAPGFFWLAGQGGAGIKTAPALAGITRALIAGEPVPAWLGASGGDAGALDPARLLV